ncbi:MAG: DUF2202 domain-containing protein [Anaerolineae bacterium]
MVTRRKLVQTAYLSAVGLLVPWTFDLPKAVGALANTGTAAHNGAAAKRNGGGPTSPLSAAEQAHLIYMREVEKAARDIYEVMYTFWGTMIFDNIPTSEQMHMDALLNMLNKYSLTDPAAHTKPGEFQNQELQAVFDILVTQGRASLRDAYRMGAEFEELDIIDLDEAMADTTRGDLLNVYDNLRTGSYHHLNAFANQLLKLTGEVYVPLHLSQAEYDAIINLGMGGSGWGGGGGGMG